MYVKGVISSVLTNFSNFGPMLSFPGDLLLLKPSIISKTSLLFGGSQYILFWSGGSQNVLKHSFAPLELSFIFIAMSVPIFEKYVLKTSTISFVSVISRFLIRSLLTCSFDCFFLKEQTVFKLAHSSLVFLVFMLN